MERPETFIPFSEEPLRRPAHVSNSGARRHAKAKRATRKAAMTSTADYDKLNDYADRFGVDYRLTRSGPAPPCRDRVLGYPLPFAIVPTGVSIGHND